MRKENYIRVLTIAGSDSGGGAGIQADLKTFSALGCYGMSAITALTAQNTCGITDIHVVPASSIKKQIIAVMEDIGVDAIKIGMLFNGEIISVVTNVLQNLHQVPVVIDPVMIAKSGEVLLEKKALDMLKKELLPLATIITPNLPEAELLLNQEIKSYNEMESAAKSLCQLGVKATLIKGGHLNKNNSPDCLYIAENKKIDWFNSERFNTKNTHGTGCTLSSAIAAFLARGFDLEQAVESAKYYLSSAIKAGSSYQLGAGYGPVKHFGENNEF